MSDFKEKFCEALEQEFNNEKSAKEFSSKFWNALDELMQAHNNAAHDGKPVHCEFRLQVVALVIHYLEISAHEFGALRDWIIVTAGQVIHNVMKDKDKEK